MDPNDVHNDQTGPTQAQYCKELRKRLGIESLSGFFYHRRMNWMEKVANMHATLDDNRLPRKLLGAWIFGGKRRSGGQRKTLCKSYLDLLCKLQFDNNNSALCGSKGNLRNILKVICNEPPQWSSSVRIVVMHLVAF